MYAYARGCVPRYTGTVAASNPSAVVIVTVGRRFGLACASAAQGVKHTADPSASAASRTRRGTSSAIIMEHVLLHQRWFQWTTATLTITSIAARDPAARMFHDKQE